MLLMPMKLDTILEWAQRLALLGFMLSGLFIVIGDLFRNTAFAVLSLYLFLGVTYVNHARKNEVNNSVVTKQVAGIVLGTVMLIIIITVLFKVVEALKLI